MIDQSDTRTLFLMDLPESLLSRYRWLYATCGYRGFDKVMQAVIGYASFAHLCMWEIACDPSADSLMIKLLDDLKAGAAIHLYDIKSYHANNQRWPKGMQVVSGKVVDVW